MFGALADLGAEDAVLGDASPLVAFTFKAGTG